MILETDELVGSYFTACRPTEGELMLTLTKNTRTIWETVKYDI